MAATTPHISLAAETIAHIGSFPITNSLLTTWILMAILVLASIILTRKLSLVPSRTQSLVELTVSNLQGLFKNSPYFPLLATLFIFIAVSNWSGLIPGLSAVGIFDETHSFTPILRAPTADLNTTLALAIISMVAVQIYGFKSIGVGYLKKFFDFSGPIQFFVGILELISEFSRLVSFTFRLFGNIFAGEVLLTVIAFLIPVILPIPFLGMEIFVGFIQALVFSLLVSVFLNLSSVHHSSSKEVTH